MGHQVLSLMGRVDYKVLSLLRGWVGIQGSSVIGWWVSHQNLKFYVRIGASSRSVEFDGMVDGPSNAKVVERIGTGLWTLHTCSHFTLTHRHHRAGSKEHSLS